MKILNFLTFLSILNCSFSVFADYDPVLAVKNAKKYALEYNASYQSFENDCTNFFSQNLRAGGLADDKYIWIYPKLTGVGSTRDINNKPYMQFLGENNIASWYYTNSAPQKYLKNKKAFVSESTYSYSWIRADSMSSRLKAEYSGWKYAGVYDLKSVTNIPVEYGDAVFVSWTLGTVNHATIVTGFQKVGNTYEPVLTYHTSNVLDLPFSTVLPGSPDGLISFRDKILRDYPKGAKVFVFRRNLDKPKVYSWQVVLPSDVGQMLNY